MNRNRSRAPFGAAAVIAALLASGAGVSPALAATTGDHGHQATQSAGGKDNQSKGDKGKGQGKNDAKKLEKAIAVADARLERLLLKADKLGADYSARFAANIAAERELLAQLTAADAVRDLRIENYERVIAGVRKVTELLSQLEAPDAAITDAAAAAVEQLFAITASSDKADLRAAKQAINELEDLVEAAVTQATQPIDPGTTDPTTP